MARCLRTNGRRPKCWIGAAIGLGTQIIGGLINKNAQEEQARAAQRVQEQQDAMNLALNKTQQMRLTQNAQKAYEEQFRLPYRRGGRQRLRNAVSITDGGIAIPEGNGTFLLRGNTHEQINESGNTGIGINVGGKEIEAENNEVVDTNNNSLRVFSNSLSIPVMTRNGIMYMTPSKAVLAGYNKNKVFNIQQAMNGNSHGSYAKEGARAALKREGEFQPFKSPLDIAGLSEYARIYDDAEHDIKVDEDTISKMTPDLYAKYSRNIPYFKGSKMGADWGTADYIGLGANVLGSILSQTINRRGLSSLRDYAPKRPLPYVAGKFVTNYNINPQLSNLERQRQQAYTSIDRDTASSVAANERRNTINLNTTLAENELYNKKYQTEADMLNKDTLNQQEVANKSIAAYNDWRENYNKYMAAIAGGRSESNVAMIQGIGNSIGNFLQQGIDRHQMGLNRRAYLATADKGNEMILNRYGLLTKKEQEAMYIDALNRNDANAATYWSNYISPRRLERISLKRI